MNMNYFKYLFRSRRIPLIFIAVIYAGICTAGSSTSNNNGLIIGMEANIVIALILTFIVPPILFRSLHSRRSSDQLLALPMSRKELLVTSLTAGVAYISLCWVITGLLVYFAPSTVHTISFARLLQGLGYGIFVITEMLIINTLLFFLANNLFDGVVVMLAYTVFPLLVNGVIFAFTNTMIAGSPSMDGLAAAGRYISPVILGFENVISFFDKNPTTFFMNFLIPLVITVGCMFGLKKHFLERPSERAEQLSGGTMAYPMLIRLYAACSLQMLAFEAVSSHNFFLVGYLSILLAYVIATFVYRRAITFHINVILRYAVSVVITLGIAFTAWQTHGFGAAENYTLGEKGYLVYSYYAYVNGDDIDGIDPDAGEEFADLSFNLNIPIDQIQDYQEVLDIVEDYRKDAIRDFYDVDEDYGVIANLNVYNETKLISATENNFYNYHTRPMSVEALKNIAKYTKVVINIYEDDTYQEYTLDEYLNREE